MTKKNRDKLFHFIGLGSGALAIVACLVTIALSVVDSFVTIYTLSTALVLLGINRIGLHLSSFKKHLVENIALTAFIFILALLVALTKYGIYFLISSMFCYSLTVILYAYLEMKEDRTPQSIVYHILVSVFAFLYSFVFFFPSIYAKHASTISNSNFMILCFSVMIIFSSSKNIIFPYHKTRKINVVTNIIKKSLAREIILGLLILVILCSVYFTLVEQNIKSYVDALWYSFAVITTIGFGDVYVTTTLGRILSVVLGISGIAVVAVFTSFIVNFYNEMNKKREDKIIKKLSEQEKELEKLEAEIKEQKEE